MRRRPLFLLLSLALAYAVVNAVKPMTIDDTAYHAYARRVADQPLDPYGFSVYWWSYPEEANEVLAPPLLAYWCAPALRLSDSPVVWKLALLPFAVLFVFALHALARRFARGLETPLVVMTLLSPTFLPSLNLMLDVPALALGLAALALFARAVDRGSFGLAALAGLLSGLALETKYTAVVTPAVLLLYALCFGGFRLWLVAAAAAAQVFLGWEFLMSLLYGEAHFFLHARYSSGSSLVKWHNFRYLIPIIGSVGWASTLLALAALGASRRVLATAAAAGLFAFAVVACYGGGLTANANLFGPFGKEEESILPFEQFVFGLFGIAALVVSVVVMTRLARSPRGLRSRPAPWFLVLWLLLEMVGYLALTPFPAVRRVMGVVVVGTFAAGWLAARTCRFAGRRRFVWGAAAYGVVLGVGFYAVDLIDARAQRDAVAEAARRVGEAGGGDAWYVGHWGFQFYAERAGMKPVVPCDMPADTPIPLPRRSLLRKGDWLVLPDGRITQQRFERDPARTEFAFAVVVTDRVPWQTVMSFYGGRSGVEHHDGTRLGVDVYRVTADHYAGR